jgi:hypothetical protein
MTTVNLRGKDYTFGNFTLFDAFQLAFFTKESANAINELNPKLDKKTYDTIAETLKYKIFDDIGDELVNPNKQMGVYLEPDELKEIYFKMVDILEKTGRITGNEEIPSLLPVEDKSQKIEQLKAELSKLED